MTRRRPNGLTALPVAVLLLTGCADQGAERAAEAPRRPLDVSVLRISEADYDPALSPEALAGQEPVVVAGVVDGWQRGPALESYEDGPLDHRVVLRIRATDVLKGTVPGGVVFVELDQGAVVRDDSLPAEKWKPAKSVADFATAIPAGTKAMAFLAERPPHEQRVLDAGEPLPARAHLMSAPPQGLVFEDPFLAARQPDRPALVGGKEPLDAAGRTPWLEPRNMTELIDRLKDKGFSG
ncbi:hypothetical protein ABT340_22965 [Streptosporangium sp. NPDC000239]|uniref:hypothetical protein n=1 Tax=Streptosporangium sp. NPDC000239 TaxID=3154248 RepID=UPI0033334DAD